MDRRPLVVYVVDDDAGVREGLGRLVRTAGYDVRPCATVDQFLSGVDVRSAGCVLLDLSLDRRGQAPLAWRLVERGLPMPVIALTGDEREAAGRQARACGARFLLRKPVDGRALLDAIEWVTTA
jgi:FixJ family two-component response regulator